MSRLFSCAPFFYLAPIFPPHSALCSLCKISFGSLVELCGLEQATGIGKRETSEAVRLTRETETHRESTNTEPDE